MGWTVSIEDEKGQVLSELNKEFEHQDFEAKDYKLLQYLDPYGDTKFNHLQLGALIEDLKKLKQRDDNHQIGEIIRLVEECLGMVHCYIVFYGD
jgi:hypothetical protein